MPSLLRVFIWHNKKKDCMRKILVIMLVFCASAVFAIVPANKLYEEKVQSVLFLETQSGTGSGIVLKEDGTFVTCFHVISNADYINAKTKDGKTYKVNGYKYLNPQNDIAILTVNSKTKFKPITLNSNVKIGDIVYTIANPRRLQFVFSDGMINQFSKEKIQFSAPTSPGSSGGALLNEAGELVGMITSQYNPSVAQNINFAVPNSYFAPYVDKKKKTNSKGLNWSEFVASSLNKKELTEFIDYASANKDYSMFYKYIRGKDEEVMSDSYALYGAFAILAYMDNNGTGEHLLNDASKWFALSILSNKNIEVSAYGLMYSMLLNGEFKDFDIYYSYLDKYPKTKRLLYKQIFSIYNCNDTKCVDENLYDMNKYLSSLVRQIYD